MPGRLYTATVGRTVAAVYDRVLGEQQEAGLREKRARLLAQARGATLEVGAGTGLNLEHYPAAVTELVLTEPGPHMAAKLREKTPREVVSAPAERLPFPDDRFETVIGTLVLCTVPDPRAALAEIARVLRPGGMFLFLEHVRAHEARVAKLQDRVTPVWRFCADGCHPNRDTLATIQASPLRVDDVAHERLPKAPPWVRPLIVGRASSP